MGTDRKLAQQAIMFIVMWNIFSILGNPMFLRCASTDRYYRWCVTSLGMLAMFYALWQICPSKIKENFVAFSTGILMVIIMWAARFTDAPPLMRANEVALKIAQWISFACVLSIVSDILKNAGWSDAAMSGPVWYGVRAAFIFEVAYTGSRIAHMIITGGRSYDIGVLSYIIPIAFVGVGIRLIWSVRFKQNKYFSALSSHKIKDELCYIGFRPMGSVRTFFLSFFSNLSGTAGHFIVMLPGKDIYAFKQIGVSADAKFTRIDCLHSKYIYREIPLNAGFMEGIKKMVGEESNLCYFTCRYKINDLCRKHYSLDLDELVLLK